MKSYLRYISIFVCFSIICALFCGFTSNNNIENETSKITRDKKILCTATIDQDFDDSSVLVIMDNIAGSINKRHELSFFGDIGATAVKDLTAITNPFILNDDVSRETTEDSSISDDLPAWFEIDTDTFRQILKIELNVHSKENVLRVIEKLETIEGIKYAGPNYKLDICVQSVNRLDPLSDITHTQWSLDEEYTNVVGAWNITTGSDNIKVGIVDSGIADHPDLSENVAGGENFHDNTGTGDTYGHGTSVASIIGAVCDNDMLINGVCKNVTLVPLKIYSTVTIDSDGEAHMNTSSVELVDVISHATNNGIHILNCSWVTTALTTAEKQAIVNYPGLVVACAGNKNNNNDDNPHYPSNLSATLNNVISVAASDKQDVIWYDDEKWGSNFGAKSVDLFAPGNNLNVLIPYDPDDKYGKYWYELSGGTSLAAPMLPAPRHS